MPQLYVSPAWFLGYDALLQLLFGLVCLVLAVFSFRISKKYSEASLGRMGAAFGLLALSYFIESAANSLVLFKIARDPYAIYSIISTSVIGTYLHLISMLAGLSLLATIGFPSIFAFWLSFLPSAAALILAENPVRTSYFLAAIYLVFLAGKFAANYLRRRQKGSLVIAAAFLLLLASNFGIILSAIVTPFLYALARFAELTSYLLILFNLYLVTAPGRRAVKRK